jgi:ABC-type antimicrobial peptide transport system permease subunit
MGAIVGIVMSKLLVLLDVSSMTSGFVSRIEPSTGTLVIALCVGLIMGVLAGLFPAIQASSMSINEAMRRLE